MATPEALNALADRAEREEPSRELEADIYIALHIPAERAGRIDKLGGVVGWWPKDGPYKSAIEVPHYTTSLDAAVTLVPEGFVWGVNNFCGAVAEVIGPEADDGHVPCGASDKPTKTPAQALTAAALRARAALSHTDEGTGSGR